jgi:RecA-family ATPase
METSEFIETVERAHQEMIDKAQPERGNFDDLSTLRAHGWLTNAPPNRKYIFDYKEAFEQRSGFLPEGKACMIASPGGCGKTFLLAHCALAAATGTEWINAKAVKPIKVLFIAAEEEEDELWNRFYNMAKGLELDRNKNLIDLALDNIIALPKRGRSQRLIDDKGEPTKSYLDLKESIATNPDIKLVILDPAVRFMGSDTETNNAAATDWVNLIDALTMIGGKPTVLVAHHTNKSALRPIGNDKKPVFDQSMCRGASALVDGFRWVLGLQRSEGEDSHRSIFIKLLKSNYSRIGPTLEFEQDFQNGGILKFKGTILNESQINSCIIEATKERPTIFSQGNNHDD